MRENSSEFRALLEAVPEALLITDGAGEIRDANTRAESLFGFPRGQILGQPVQRVLPGGPGQADPSLVGVRADGSEFPAEVSFSLWDTSEGPLSVLAVRDVSERRRLEQERATLAQAQEAIRMRDEFLSIVSHELKTPLTVLAMQSESIELAAAQGAAGGVSERIERKAKTIKKAANRLELLVNQLLDLSRITAGRLEIYPEQVNLAELVATIAEHFQEVGRQAGSTIHIVAAEPVWGCWDALRTEQIVTNLISNAIKYGCGNPIEISVSQSEEHARIIVRDHGIGIDPQHQKRIFERFERLASERHYGGFGLGLWIVRQLIEAQGGKIDVWSRPGEGSAFTVELPRKLECVAQTMPPSLDLHP